MSEGNGGSAAMVLAADLTLAAGIILLGSELWLKKRADD